jgi:hypothetical protein
MILPLAVATWFGDYFQAYPFFCQGRLFLPKLDGALAAPSPSFRETLANGAGGPRWTLSPWG